MGKTAVLLAVAAALGQAQSAFEVASIKQNTSGDRWESVSPISAGRFTARNVTVGWLLKNAYRVEPFQIAGLPGWANSERYDISAKAAGDTATPDEVRMMLRTLPQKSDWGRHIASIPNGVLLKWMLEEGVPVYGMPAHEWDRFLRKKLSDPEWRDLRTDK